MVTCSCSPSLPLCSVGRCFKSYVLFFLKKQTKLVPVQVPVQGFFNSDWKGSHCTNPSAVCPKRIQPCGCTVTFNLFHRIHSNLKRNLNRRFIYECRWDERLKDKDEGSTCLTYTGFCGGLEHLKIETRLINESFPSVMGECVILTSQVCRRYSI
jgi:hypothetical protein